MDSNQLLASMTGNLAWPLAVLIMFFFVRDRIGQLLEKLGKLKYKDLELDFSKIKQLNTTKESVKNQDQSILIKNPESTQVFGALEEQIFEAVESAPAASILLAWSYIETSLVSAISRLNYTENISSASPLKNIQILEHFGKLTPEQLELLHEMRILRNTIAHGASRELNINPDKALDYAKTSIEMARYLDGLDRKNKIFLLPEGKWIRQPEGFFEHKDRSANSWKYSCIDIPGTNLTAGAGPWTVGTKDEYFGIDIEQQRKGASTVVTELLIDLEYVSKDLLNADARKFISYNETTRVVTFDLGKSIFEYQLH
jgi:hypothetical protein